MLYKKKNEKELPDSLFEAPTAEYRGAPFWAWNCDVTKPLLDEQIDVLKEMGFGGFHMHPRTGFATPYLSDEHMELVRFCTEKAKNEKMYAYLYDEDRWPSGAAGGIVTRDPQFRQRFLSVSPEAPVLADGEKLLACYDVMLDESGCLKSGHRIAADEEASGVKWYAVLKIALPDPWFNNQTYADTLNPEAIRRFIEVTYETYRKSISEDFGVVVPSVFTDEPQFARKGTLSFPEERKEVCLPWTDDLPQTFEAAYGEDILERLPELFWELPGGKVSTVRYHYHDHVTERFTEAFADQCGRWCSENGLMLTGHMMEEPTLASQTASIGEAMRPYRSFQLPGIDMLCNDFEYTTAKQAQSAAHQFGREGIMSELYGVTGWTYDFRGHKIQGDWQAALGVTLRVPHLSWVSMEGEAKRDYPASINYQSPWYREYSCIEDHFARVNTAMTRGRPLVRVGVIHPVESYWLHWGPSQQTSLVRQQLQENFENVTQWLLFGGIDFDFISESLLPEQCAEGAAPLAVGEMAYDVILVPGCETLRSTTLKRLKKFRKQGGRLIFLGEAPKYLDAEESEKPEELYEKSEKLPFSRASLLHALEDVRLVEFWKQDGSLTDNLIYQIRQDGESRWLFVAHGKEPAYRDVSIGEKITLAVKGNWTLTLYNTLDGTIQPLNSELRGGRTETAVTLFNHDSLLLKLSPRQAEPVQASLKEPVFRGAPLPLPKVVPIVLEEPNVLLLDHAEYALDDENYAAAEEILRLDNILRQKAGYPSRQSAVAQPWTIPVEPFVHMAHLRMTIESTVEVESVSLALECAETTEICFNGEKIPSEVTGWFTDRSIQTVPLGRLQKGSNILELAIPFGKRSNLEWCYLLGDFGVRVRGAEVTVTEPVHELGFGDVTSQGLPFYGGNIRYRIPAPAGETVEVQIPHYRGALTAVSGMERKRVVFAPYTASVKVPESGELEITLFGNRANSFGALHRVDETNNWLGPDSWRTTGDRWTESYRLFPMGLLSAPVIRKPE